MKRVGVYLSLLLATLTLLAGWLMMNLERVPVHLREPPQAEARRNSWLALERFTARMGGKLLRESDARILDRPPAGATLLLDRQRAHLLPPERLRRLLAWVEQGGKLIAVAELPGVADPLVDSLGVRRLEQVQPTSGRPRAVYVAPPGAVRPLAIAASPRALAAGTRQPAWSGGKSESGAQFLHFHIGSGHLTIAADLDDQLSNGRIGEMDHAELYWTLLAARDRSASPQVLLLSRLQMPSLAEWLWENAWAACVACGTLIALWLWRIVPRFGGTQPELPQARRELREHLAAVGRYLWRSGNLAALLAPAREHFRNRLAQRQPGIAAQPADAQAAALAVLSGRRSGHVAAALAGHVDTPHAFTEAVRTLYHLERDL